MAAGSAPGFVVQRHDNLTSAAEVGAEPECAQPERRAQRQPPSTRVGRTRYELVKADPLHAAVPRKWAGPRYTIVGGYRQPNESRLCAVAGAASEGLRLGQGLCARRVDASVALPPEGDNRCGQLSAGARTAAWATDVRNVARAIGSVLRSDETRAKPGGRLGCARMGEFEFFEIVRVRSTPETIREEIAGLEGAVLGKAAEDDGKVVVSLRRAVTIAGRQSMTGLRSRSRIVASCASGTTLRVSARARTSPPAS
jgi:hypothetical protein